MHLIPWRVLTVTARAVALTTGLIAVAPGALARADGGFLRVRQEVGPFIVSVFTAPELRVGPIDVSVLVQSRDGRVLTDAVVDVLLESATAPIERRRARASRTAASNKLEQMAILEIPSAGQWILTVSVSFTTDSATVTSPLPVAARLSRMSVIWPWLLAPPGAIGLFALHQRLKHERSPARSARARPPLLHIPPK